jgi:SAM-dependent methyltransferase
MDERQKQHLVRLVRRARLLPFAEGVKGMIAAIKTRRSNRRFCREHPGVPMPPTGLMHDPYGTMDYVYYWKSGQRAAKAVADVIKSRCHSAGSLKILEWGCGPARVIRHLSMFHPVDQFTIFGTDYNERMIDWCRSSLPKMDFRINALKPPLDHASGFFDFVYCLSVFTHLSEEMHHAWLAELLRVTRPGGVILLTLHGDYYRRKLLPDELVRYNAGEIVVRDGFIEGGRMYTTFHGERFIRERFFKDVEIVQHDSNPENPILPLQDVWTLQDVWIVRKRI